MGYSILHSDIFRSRTTNYLNVNFTDGLSLDTGDYRFIKIRIGQLLENILLYDRVYVESPEIPIVVRFLKSKDALLEAVSKENISLLNTQGHEFIKSIKNGYFYTLASGKMPLSYLPLTNEQELEELIQSPGWAGDFSKLTKPLFKSVRNLPSKTNKNIVKGVENDFKVQEFRDSLNLSSKSPKLFSKKEAVIVDQLIETYFRTIVASELGINNIFIDNTLLNIINQKMENFVDIKDYYYKAGLYKVFDVYNVPNIPELFMEEKIDLEDILYLKSSNGYRVFIEWLREQTGFVEKDFNENDFHDLTRGLINEVEKRTKDSSVKRFLKPFRIVGAIYVGFNYSPEIGAGLTLVDNLLIDRFLKTKSPKMFLDDYSNLVEHKYMSL